MRAIGVAAFVVGIACACGSSPPPKSAEPEAAPLEIPPLPPQKEAPQRPAARDVGAGSAESQPEERPMAVPGPLALPCRDDADCMTHRCNMQFAKCAFPCKSDHDCIAGATCFVQGGPTMATCIPKPVP